MWKITVLLALFCGMNAVSGTALADSAAAMAPGTWKSVYTGDLKTYYPQSDPITVYATRGLWSEPDEKFFFWGAVHGARYKGGIEYDARLNQWKTAPSHDTSRMGHTYGNLVWDSKRNQIFFCFNSIELHQFDIAAETWTKLAPGGSLPGDAWGTASEYFPEKDGIIHLSNSNIKLYDIASNTWRTITQSSDYSGYNGFVSYNPVYRCLFVAGGTNATPSAKYTGYQNYKLDTNEVLTPIKKSPFPIHISFPDGCDMVCDPISGTYLFMRADSLYGYDIKYDYWFNLGRTPGLDFLHCVTTPMRNYGVTAFYYERVGGIFSTTHYLWLYKYAGHVDTLPVVNTRILMQSDTIEQYRPVPLRAISTYSGGLMDTSDTRCAFFAVDTDIVYVPPVGRIVIGRKPGVGRIAVIKRGAVDTVMLTVKPLAHPADSVRLSVQSLILSVGENYPVKATAYFHDGALQYSHDVTDQAAWESSAPAVADVTEGRVQGLSAGDNTVIRASVGGASDSMTLMVHGLTFLKRINFTWYMATPPFSQGWVDDYSYLYTEAQGYGWLVKAPPNARGDRLGANILLKSFVSTCAPCSRIDYKVACPDGEYIIKFALGDNNYGSTDSVWYGSELLFTHSGASNGIAIDTVAVTGGNGLILTVNGVINYLVVISNQGVDINSVTMDDGTVIPYMDSRNEKNAEIAAAITLTSVPNPFNPESRIAFSLPSAGPVRLDVYDIKGRFIRNLASGRTGAGSHAVVWNGRDKAGKRVSAGIYVYRLTAGPKVLLRKAILAK